jgi:hypothetical protein
MRMESELRAQLAQQQRDLVEALHSYCDYEANEGVSLAWQFTVAALRQRINQTVAAIHAMQWMLGER